MWPPSVHEIAAVLAEEWDPIGVSEMDVSPEQEYLYEATELFRMLADGAVEADVVTYLSSRDLGHVDATRVRSAAAKLWDMRS